MGGGLGGLKGTQICPPGDKIWDNLLEEAALVMGLEGRAGRESGEETAGERETETGNKRLSSRPTLDGAPWRRGQGGAKVSCTAWEGLECQTRNTGIVFCRQRKLRWVWQDLGPDEGMGRRAGHEEPLSRE